MNDEVALRKRASGSKDVGLCALLLRSASRVVFFYDNNNNARMVDYSFTYHLSPSMHSPCLTHYSRLLPPPLRKKHTVMDHKRPKEGGSSRGVMSMIRPLASFSRVLEVRIDNR
jgi:hypothetical protein